MDRCPVCRARLSAPVCRRCGADFSQAEQLLLQTRSMVLESLHLWQQGYFETAAQLLHKSLLHKHEKVLEHLLNAWLQQLLQQAIQHLKHDCRAESEHLCQSILAIKYIPLVAQLQAFLAGHDKLQRKA